MFLYCEKEHNLFLKKTSLEKQLICIVFFSHDSKNSFPYLRSGSPDLQRSNSEMSSRWKIRELHRGLDVTGTRVRHSSR